jgi:tetratricopeptide (TPR) repeat protein
MRKIIFILFIFPCFLFGQNIDSLKLALKNAKHDTTRAQILYSWGTQIYLELPDSGIILFQNVVKIAEETKNKYKKSGTENKAILLSQANSLSYIGYAYYNLKNIPKALEYYGKSSKIYEETGDRRGLAVNINNFASIYYDQGDITKALEYFRISLKIREEIGDKQGVAYALHNIGVIYFKQDNLKEGFIYAKKGMDIAKEIGYPENIKKAAKLLKRIFQKQNKYKEAFEMYELEIKMRDSINNEETQKAAVKKQMQYEYETQAKDLQNEQDKKDIIAKAELQQKEKERNYFIIGFALVIVLAGFIFRSYRQKQKANLIITQQKHEVEESRKEILDSIHYAKRIQKAHLPTQNYIEKNLNRLQSKE